MIQVSIALLVVGLVILCFISPPSSHQSFAERLIRSLSYLILLSATINVAEFIRIIFVDR